MPQSENRAIALIVTPDAGTILLELAKTHYLWIRTSQQHTPVLALIHDKTTFTASDATLPEDLVLDYLDTIDLHHPAWNQLRIIGTPLTDAIQEAIQAYGSVSFHVDDRGFSAER